VSAADLSDESLLRYYDSIRKQVEADRGNTHKFMSSDSIKQHAESLRLELYKRRLHHAPIDWWTDQPTDTAVSLPKSDASGGLVSLDRNPVADVSAAEPVEETKIGNRDPIEQLSHLQSRIDALIKGSDGLKAKGK
jgi:hypothetical protein